MYCTKCGNEIHPPAQPQQADEQPNYLKALYLCGEATL